MHVVLLVIWFLGGGGLTFDPKRPHGRVWDSALFQRGCGTKPPPYSNPLEGQAVYLMGGQMGL